MPQTQPVLWTKGVLLTPQHLQTQDRFLEDTLGLRLSSLAFAPWGFSRLEVDREALAGGSLALTAARGMLPDGLLFDMPDGDPLPPPRPLEDHFLPDQPSLLVFLAVPEHRPGGYNVSMDRAEGTTRYRAEVVLRRDENTGLGEKPIQVARKNLRLLVEGESLEGYSALPVARVLREASGAMAPDPRFIPPLLDVAASETLRTMAGRLLELLSARSSALAGSRRQRGVGLAGFGVADVASFWLLYTVNTSLPRLRHLAEVRQGHPALRWGALLELAGSLCTLSSSHHPGMLPAYDHTAPGRCFVELDGVIRELLQTVVPSNYVALPLRPTPESEAIRVAELEEEEYLAATRWYLVVTAAMPVPDLVARVPQLVKVSSADQVDRLVRQALPGVSLTHVPDPPGAVPVRLNHHYFRLEPSGPAWEAIRKARNVAAYVPSDFPEARVELGLLLPPRE